LERQTSGKSLQNYGVRDIGTAREISWRAGHGSDRTTPRPTGHFPRRELGCRLWARCPVPRGRAGSQNRARVPRVGAARQPLRRVRSQVFTWRPSPGRQRLSCAQQTGSHPAVLHIAAGLMGIGRRTAAMGWPRSQPKTRSRTGARYVVLQHMKSPTHIRTHP